MMSALFIVFVCAEIGGEKLNLELAFNGRPTMEELKFRIEEAFDVAQNFHVRGAAVEPFVVVSLAAYDAQRDAWYPLQSAQRLRDQMQLYAFRHFRARPADIVGALPKAVLPPSAVVQSQQRRASPHPRPRARSPQSRARAPSSPSSEADGGTSATIVLSPGDGRRAASRAEGSSPGPGRVHVADESRHANTDALFALLDPEGTGVIRLGQLRDAMLMCNMDISRHAVGDTFDFGDQQISAHDFRGFGRAYGNVVQVLRRRLEERERRLQERHGAMAAPDDGDGEEGRHRHAAVAPAARSPPSSASSSRKSLPPPPLRRPPPRRPSDHWMASGQEGEWHQHPRSSGVDEHSGEQQLWSATPRQLHGPSASAVPAEPPGASVTPHRSGVPPRRGGDRTWCADSNARNDGGNVVDYDAGATTAGLLSPARSGPSMRQEHVRDGTLCSLASRGAGMQYRAVPVAGGEPCAAQIERLLEREGELSRELDAVRRERAMLEAAERTVRETAPQPLSPSVGRRR